jgi:hypothetical protein
MLVRFISHPKLDAVLAFQLSVQHAKPTDTLVVCPCFDTSFSVYAAFFSEKMYEPVASICCRLLLR